MLCLLAPLAVPARTLPELERALARDPPQVTPFTEYRFTRLMKRVVIADGVLEYRARGVWVRRVEKPTPESAEIANGEIRVRRGAGAERRISLDRAPQLRLLLDSLGAMLEGRITTLDPLFTVSMKSSESGWAIRLEPRDAKFSKHVARIDVFGTGDAPGCIEIAEPDGDASFTLLGDTQLPRASGDQRPERADVEARCRAMAGNSGAR